LEYATHKDHIPFPMAKAIVARILKNIDAKTLPDVHIIQEECLVDSTTTYEQEIVETPKASG